MSIEALGALKKLASAVRVGVGPDPHHLYEERVVVGSDNGERR